MSSRPPLQIVDPNSPAARRDELPGCGLGLYAMLLILLGGLGLAGIGFATWALLAKGMAVNPKGWISGTEVQAFRLQPMRDAGLIGPDEVPAAWHDESDSLVGTPACAVLADRIVRVQEGDDRSLLWTDADSVDQITSGDGMEAIIVTAKPDSGQQDIGCRFGPGEGAHSMLRQVEVELLRAQRGG